MIKLIFPVSNYEWAENDGFQLFITIIVIIAILLIAIILYRLCIKVNRNTAFGDKLYSSLRHKSAPLLVISKPRSNIATNELSLSLDDKICLSLKKQLPNEMKNSSFNEKK